MRNAIVAAVAGLALTTGGALAATAPAAVAAPSGSSAAAARTAPPGGPVPAGFRVASVTFVSASEGWVLGTYEDMRARAVHLCAAHHERRPILVSRPHSSWRR